MGTFGEGLKSFNWITDRIEQVSKWIKGNKRRKDVQKMDDALSDNNDGVINDKLSALKRKVKNRDDSK